MRAPRQRRLSAVFLVLAAITVGYLVLDASVDEHGAPRASTAVTVVAVLLALVKVRIIFREFMEVRHAPALLGRLTDLWVALVGVTLIGSYLVGLAVPPAGGWGRSS